MKVVTVVGARPQFIKAAVVSRILRIKHEEVIVHTGQHFDYNMSEQFFEELSIPKPDYNLSISGGSHAEMTGRMMIAIEEVLIKEKPDWVLIYGDTNSTLAAALAASKLYIPICHVEAGLRTHSKTNPEEINRICVDHVSTLLLTSTKNGIDELYKEGLGSRAFFVGDTMYDAFLQYKDSCDLSDIQLENIIEKKEIDVPTEFYLLTCHREENTNTDEKLYEILCAMNQLETPTIYPVHPRNRQSAIRIHSKHKFDNVIMTNPVGYLESIALVNNAKKIVTDSGGIQREAFYAQKKCITILDFVIWKETMVGQRNELCKPNKNEIIEKLSKQQQIDLSYQPFGDGNAAKYIVEKLENSLV